MLTGDAADTCLVDEAALTGDAADTCLVDEAAVTGESLPVKVPRKDESGKPAVSLFNVNAKKSSGRGVLKIPSHSINYLVVQNPLDRLKSQKPRIALESSSNRES